MDDKPKRRRFHPIYILLAVPFIGLLWVPFYNRAFPTLFGIPFFYWYQTGWALGSSICMAPLYFYEEWRRK